MKDEIKKLSNTYSYLSFRLSALKELIKDGGKTLFTNFQNEYNRNFQILRYERIVEPDKLLFPIPNTSFVTPRTFQKHCKCLRKFCNVISLPTLLESLREGTKIPERSVVITIDGGHLDSFLNSTVPLMENGLNATYFVATSYIGSQTLFPEDRISYICERLKFSGKKILRTENTIKIFKKFQENEDIKELEYNSNTLNDILKLYRSLKPEQGEMLIRQLGEYTKNIGPLAAPLPDFMEWKDLDYLQSLGMHIGAIGHSYIPNIYLSEEQIYEDLETAKTHLIDSEIKPVDLFAAPYDIIAPQALDAIASLNAEFVLNGHSKRIDTEQTPMILGRKHVLEATSFSEDLFIKDIWS